MEVHPLGHSFEQGYTVREVVTRDALFTVYLAEDRKHDRPCFIQEFENRHPDGEAAYRNFEREFSRLQGVSDGRLLRLCEHFRQGEKVYLVTETHSGKSLKEIVSGSRDPLAEIECIDLALKICRALESIKTVSGDPCPVRILDPASLELTPERELKIADYGLWAIFNPAWDPSSPGMNETELASNLGKILYYCLTRIDPWSASPEELPPPREANPDISPGMETLINRCRGMAGEKPYESIGDLRRDLNSVKTYGALVVQETMDEWSSDSPEPSQEKPPVRKKADVLIPVLSLLLILAAGCLAFYFFRDSGRKKETRKPEIFYSTVYTELLGMHEGLLWAKFYSKSYLMQTPTIIQMNLDGSAPRVRPSQLPVPPGNIVRLISDGSKNTWFLSTNGLFNLKDRKLNNVAIPEFSDITLDRDGSLWASNESGFAVYNGKSWQRYLLLPSMKVVPMDGRRKYPRVQSLSYARSIAVDGSGRLFRTLENGVLCADRKTWRKFTPASGIEKGEFTFLFRDSKNRIWAGGKKSGDRPLIQSFSDNRWTSLPTGQTAGKGGIKQILEDPSGKVLFVVINGWYELDGERLVFQPISSLPGYDAPYVLDAVNSISFDRGNRMWLACFEILLRHDDAGWKVFPAEDIYKPI
jgi:hypothetical protein